MIPAVFARLDALAGHPHLPVNRNGQLCVGCQEDVMSTKMKSAFVAAMITTAIASPAFAHTAHHHYAAAHGGTFCNCSSNNGTLYNFYVPAQAYEIYWPSAAALGNSH
jgi:hypothetical protein